MVAPVHQRNANTEAAHRTQTNSMLQKTKLCHFFSQGHCGRGAACAFAHGEEQLVPQPDLYRTVMCFDFIRAGGCRVGAACKFAHSPGDLRPKLPRARGAAATGHDAVQRRIAEVQRQAEQLQEQLAALQQLAARAEPAEQARRKQKPSRAQAGKVPPPPPARAPKAPPAPTGCSTPSCLSVDDRLDAPMGNFTRQSTEEPTSEVDYWVTRRRSEDDWEALSGCWSVDQPSPDLANSVADLVEDVGLTIVVRKTFIEVEQPAATLAASRRARSAPAATTRIAAA